MSAFESSGSRNKKHRRPLFKSYSLNPFPEKFNSSGYPGPGSHIYTSLSSPRRRVTSKNKSMICSCINTEEQLKLGPQDPILDEHRRVRGERLDKIASYHHLPRIRLSRSSSREDVERRRRHSMVQGKEMTQFQPQPVSAFHPPSRKLQRSSSAHIINGRLLKYFQESMTQKFDFDDDDGLGRDEDRRRQESLPSSSDEDKPRSPDPGLGSSETDSLEMELAVLNFGEEESCSSSSSEDTISLKCIKESLMYYKYAASRGQREKELEICEVIPTQISC